MTFCNTHGPDDVPCIGDCTELLIRDAYQAGVYAAEIDEGRYLYEGQQPEEEDAVVARLTADRGNTTTPRAALTEAVTNAVGQYIRDANPDLGAPPYEVHVTFRGPVAHELVQVVFVNPPTPEEGQTA